MLSALAVVLVISAVYSVKDAMEPAPPPPTAALEHYLLSHSLTRGIGDYWAASIVTVDTHNRVVVRPVVANLRHRIVPDGRNSDLDWYRNKRFQFLVYQSLPYGRVEARTIAATFGHPRTVAQIGDYYVATWRKALRLAPTPFP